jgi:hypothetical protein
VRRLLVLIGLTSKSGQTKGGRDWGQRFSNAIVAKHYFDFHGQDLPGFQNMEDLNARTNLNLVRFSWPSFSSQPQTGKGSFF